MSQLLLTVPSQSSISDPRVECDLSRLRQWLNNLPLANIDAAIPAINEALAALNRQAIPLQTRINLIEAYTEAAQPLLDTINTPSAGNRNTDRQRQGNLQFQNLVKELGYAYKIVLNDGVDQMQNRKVAGTMVLATYRAMAHLSLGILHAFKIYEPSPPQGWREVRQLYNWAKQQGLEKHLLKISTAFQPETSIEQLFKRTTMLSLSDPYHLPQDEIIQINQFLDFLGDQIDLVSPEIAPGGPGQFLIDLGSDSAPIPFDEPRDDLDGGRFQVVLTNRLVDSTQDIHNEYSIDETIKLEFQPYSTRGRNLTFFERLQNRWWQKARRVHDREEKMGWLGVTCGLLATHHFLNGQSDMPAPAPVSTSEDEDIEISSILASDMPRPNTNTAYRTKQCRLINQSSGGLSIGMQRPIEANFRIGQVLGIHSGSGSNRDDWFIGVVRWFSQIREDEVKIGIQEIQGDLEISDVEAVGDSTNLIGKQSVLLVSGPEMRPKTCKVLAPHGTYGRDRELLVTIDSQTRQVHTDQLIESTGSFDFFTCNIH